MLSVGCGNSLVCALNRFITLFQDVIEPVRSPQTQQLREIAQPVSQTTPSQTQPSHHIQKTFQNSCYSTPPVAEQQTILPPHQFTTPLPSVPPSELPQSQSPEVHDTTSTSHQTEVPASSASPKSPPPSHGVTENGGEVKGNGWSSSVGQEEEIAHQHPTNGTVDGEEEECADLDVVSPYSDEADALGSVSMTYEIEVSNSCCLNTKVSDIPNLV